MHAANKGYTLLVPPLLEAKADPDVRAPDGATALFMAALHKHSEIIALLMRAGANDSIKGPNRQTAGDIARVQYGGLSGARQDGESTAVLNLIEKGKPTRQEIEKSIRSSKRVVERELLKCDVIYKSPQFKPGWRIRVTGAAFVGDRLEINTKTGYWPESRHGPPGDGKYEIQFSDSSFISTMQKYRSHGNSTPAVRITGNITYRWVISSGTSGTGSVPWSFIGCKEKRTTDTIARELKSINNSLRRL